MWIFLAGLIFSGYLNFAAARMHTKGSSPGIADSAKSASGIRTFLGPDITPEFLQEPFKNHTEIQARGITNIYIGKWMTVSGQIFNVSPQALGKGLMVTLRNDGITLFFDEKWTDQLSILRPGNVMTAIGRIIKIERFGITLWECELHGEQNALIAAKTGEIAALEQAKQEAPITIQEQRQRESVRHTLADFSDQEKAVVRYVLDHGEVSTENIRSSGLDEKAIMSALRKAVLGALILERLEPPPFSVSDRATMIVSRALSTHSYRVNPSLEAALIFVFA